MIACCDCPLCDWCGAPVHGASGLDLGHAVLHHDCSEHYIAALPDADEVPERLDDCG